MTATLAPVVMDAAAARRLTERIRLTAFSARENIARLHSLVDEAKAGSAWIALDYPSWTAYLADVFGEEPLRLPRDQRQELVGYLAGEGMSVRAIASVTGTSVGQAHADRVQVFSSEHLSPAPTVDRATGEVLETARAETATPAETPRPPIVGLDGKTYTRPIPPRPVARRPLPDQFFDAAYDLAKVIERVHRLTDDDRFPTNAEKVAAKHRNDLLRCQDLLEQVISRLA